MFTNTTGGLLQRMLALVAAGFLAASAVLVTSTSAAADDLDNTSDDVLAEIEAAEWPEYQEGDADIDIAAAKLLLIEHGYDPHFDADRPIDFDAHMEAAVRAYQSSNDLVEDGKLEGPTWDLLLEQTFGEYGPGTSGPVVEAIQRLLNAKFHLHLDPDGEYGPQTEEAVEEAQEFFGIGVDGIVGQHSWRALITYQDYDR